VRGGDAPYAPRKKLFFWIKGGASHSPARAVAAGRLDGVKLRPIWGGVAASRAAGFGEFPKTFDLAVARVRPTAQPDNARNRAE